MSLSCAFCAAPLVTGLSQHSKNSTATFLITLSSLIDGASRAKKFHLKTWKAVTISHRNEAIKSLSYAVSKLLKMVLNTFGSIRAVSTRVAALSFQKQLIPCLSGIPSRPCVTHTLMM